MLFIYLQGKFIYLYIYRETMSLDDSGYDSPSLKKSQSRHKAASADECLEEDDSKSVR